MTLAPHLPSSTFSDADPWHELAAREAELDRREAALREAEQGRAKQNEAFAIASSVQTELEERMQDIELRERELNQARAGLDWQRERLAAVQAEYESRREALAARAREVDAERRKLQEEQAKLVSMNLELERRLNAGEEPDGKRAPRPAMPVSEREWWSKQLGSPLEAA